MSERDDLRQIGDRLDRFESNVNSKLEVLTQALIKLARTEEKILSMDREIKELHERSIKIVSDQIANSAETTKELNTVKTSVKENSDSMNTISRFFWLVTAALISSGVGIIATLMM